jgi:hypothetical protein
MVTWYIDKSLDKADSSVAEDGGLAIPPMDVGALFMSQATTIQHVSEVLNYKTFSFVPFPSGAKTSIPFL